MVPGRSQDANALERYASWCRLKPGVGHLIAFVPGCPKEHWKRTRQPDRARLWEDAPAGEAHRPVAGRVDVPVACVRVIGRGTEGLARRGRGVEMNPAAVRQLQNLRGEMDAPPALSMQSTTVTPALSPLHRTPPRILRPAAFYTRLGTPPSLSVAVQAAEWSPGRRGERPRRKMSKHAPWTVRLLVLAALSSFAALVEDTSPSTDTTMSNSGDEVPSPLPSRLSSPLGSRG